MRQFKVSADHKEIIFVAHSMGGLITIKYLLRNPDVAKKVPLVFLYSTPLNGSNIAKIGAFFSDNPGLPAMYPNESENDRNFYLTSLIDDWKDKIYNKGGPTIRCAYEKEPIAGNLIVDRVSASLICIGRSVAIPANHKNMFRKADYNSVSYLALKDAISENERIIKMRKTDQADGSELKAKYPYGYCLFTVDDRNIITPYSSTFSRDYDIGWDLAMILNSTENEINLQLPSINSL
jgi:pimeloyl-ACP methyl ester carboxylesterase